MANFSTWSGDFSGTAAGTNGKDTTLTLSSGRALTSSDQIKNITFTLRITCSRYSVSKTWDLHWFAVDSSTGSPYANPISTAMSAAEHTFSGTMEFDASDIWKFFYDEITVYAKANTTHSYTSYMREATITVEYETASLTSPTNLKITQHATDGTYTLKWDAAVGTNGTGNVTYQVWSVSDREPLSNEITTTSYTANVPGYGYFFEYRVYAYYSGVSASSTTIGSHFNPPSITAPTLSLLADSGDSATLVWSNPIINYGTASKYDYTIQYSTGETSNAKYTTIINQDAGARTLTIPSSWFEQDAKDGETIVFNIVVTAHINSYVADSAYNTLTTTTGTVFFTYDGAYTVGYYTDSGWQPCVVYCYTDSGWKECIPYYYNNNSTWIPIKTKI